MADQHNQNIPALGNAIADDIPDIKENIEYLVDVLQAFVNQWSDTVATNIKPKVIGDADNDTLVQCEESADEDIIRFDIGGTEQLTIQDGKIEPTTDDDVDLGSANKQFKDLYVDGKAYVDEIDFNGTAISATAAEINATCDGATATAAEINTACDGSTAKNNHDHLSPLTIPGCAFNTAHDRDPTYGNVYTRNDALLTNTPYYAPVMLPNGVTVSKVTLYGYRDDAAASMVMSLDRTTLADGTVVAMAGVTADWTGGISNGYDDSISNGTIDNDTYAYTIDIALDPNDATGDVRIIAVKIEFAY